MGLEWAVENRQAVFPLGEVGGSRWRDPRHLAGLRQGSSHPILCLSANQVGEGLFHFAETFQNSLLNVSAW